MLWLLGYLIIGMVYVALRTRPTFQRTLKEDDGDNEKELATFIALLVAICIITPVYPAFVALDIVSLLKKK